MANKVKAGVIGCGCISAAYFEGSKPFDMVEIVACADIQPDRAKEKAKEFEIPRVCSVEELLADPEVQIVLNLTIPAAHAEINMAALNAGKHTYCEKPLAVSLEDGRKTMKLAQETGLRVGCAPDTFLGGGIQTCRKLIDDGWIGTPVAATAFMMSPGVETWHPNPEFYYKVGGGPMLDMGPYYLTAMVNMLGPVERVAGSTKITRAQRLITSEPFAGQIIDVETPTHVTGVLDFEAGVTATMVMSFDVHSHQHSCIEIYGTEGSLCVPDPNCFGGPVKIRRAGAEEWSEVPLTHSDKVARGIGMADMAQAILTGRDHRASGAMAAHVLEVMHAFETSSNNGKHEMIESRCERPAALPMGLAVGDLD